MAAPKECNPGLDHGLELGWERNTDAALLWWVEHGQKAEAEARRRGLIEPPVMGGGCAMPPPVQVECQIQAGQTTACCPGFRAETAGRLDKSPVAPWHPLYYATLTDILKRLCTVESNTLTLANDPWPAQMEAALDSVAADVEALRARADAAVTWMTKLEGAQCVACSDSIQDGVDWKAIAQDLYEAAHSAVAAYFGQQPADRIEAFERLRRVTRANTAAGR